MPAPTYTGELTITALNTYVQSLLSDRAEDLEVRVRNATQAISNHVTSEAGLPPETFVWPTPNLPAVREMGELEALEEDAEFWGDSRGTLWQRFVDWVRYPQYW